MKTKSEIRYNELLREIRIKNYGKELLKRDEREEHEKIKNTTEWNDEKKKYYYEEMREKNERRFITPQNIIKKGLLEMRQRNERRFIILQNIMNTKKGLL